MQIPDSTELTVYGRHRRAVLLAALSGAAAALTGVGATAAPAERFDAAIRELETAVGGRLGVALLTADAVQVQGHRLNERFALCSTFKLLLAAVIFRKAQEGELQLDALVHYAEDAIQSYSPVTSKHVGRGFMSVESLAKAAQTTSDNTAANLLLDLIGGPQGFTDAVRQMGDDATRLDRYEPEMNRVPAGEVRDTTTPAAMARTVRTLFASSILSSEHQGRLRQWTEQTTTGRRRLRAGFPSTWSVGDKTGTAIAESMANKYNDVAVIWPSSGGPPIVLAVYYEADRYYAGIRPEDEAVLADVARMAARHLVVD